VYSPLSAFDLAGIYDDLMENLRVRYVITYKSGSDRDPDAPRSIRIELVDPSTGGPLKIVNANGKTINSKITVEDSYIPRSASVTGWDISAVSPARQGADPSPSASAGADQ
jgi:hypothetical protein